MAIWPSYLPAPQTDAGVVFGSNVESSGSGNGLVFGSGKPDTISAVFRMLHAHPIHGNQSIKFINFYLKELNMGVNWFSSDWLYHLFGYQDHRSRIVTFFDETVFSGVYTDVNIQMYVKKSTSCPEDTIWV